MKINWLLIWSCVLSQMGYGQELEARAYANLPKDMNAVALGYAFSKGSIVAEAALPIDDFTINANSLALRYVRSFGVAGKLARIHATVPFVHMTGQLKVSGQDTGALRTGFGDARVQVGINLIGSPALDRKEFYKYRQRTIVGVTLITSLPTGQYLSDKRINLGSNRWGFKPEVGVSRRFNRVYTDAYAGMWFYTRNTSYLSTKLLEQDPILSTQVHVSYYFKSQMMIGVNGNWFHGGQTFIDQEPFRGAIDHWRVGATWAMPFAGKHVVKLQFHTTAHSNSGSRFYMASLGYQYVFF